MDRTGWINLARKELAPYLKIKGKSITQVLQNKKQLEDILFSSPTSEVITRTFHETKGKQYPGICIVLTTSNVLKNVLDHLENPDDTNLLEETRELFVGASRAEKLLVFVTFPQT